MGKHNEFGKLGEQLAVDFLVKEGYEIVQRNFRYLKGELDIIAKKDGIMAIVEVKSRSSDFLENIAETVNQKKIKLLVATADAVEPLRRRADAVLRPPHGRGRGHPAAAREVRTSHAAQPPETSAFCYRRA